MPTKSNAPMKEIQNSTTWIVIVCLVLGFVGGFLVARARYKTQLKVTHSIVEEKVAELEKLKAGKVVLQDGQLWIMKDGDISLVDEEVVLEDGTSIDNKGHITSKDGSTSMMKDGQTMSVEEVVNY